MKLRFLPLFLLILGSTAINDGCGGETSGPTTPNPSNSESTLTLSPWAPLPGLEGGAVQQLAFAPDTVFALGDSGVYSLAADGSFSLLGDNPKLHAASLAFDALAYSELFDTLYSIVGGSLFRRDGDTWANEEQKAHSILEFDGTLYLRRQGEILKSSDGKVWTSLTSIPSELSGGVCCLSRLVGDPVRDRLYLFNNKGVFFYSLATQAWSAMNVGDDLNQGPLTSLQSLAVDPTNGNVFVGTVFDLYQSTDGQSWSPPLFKQQTGAWGTPVLSIAFDGATLYVATNSKVYSRVGSGSLIPLPDLGDELNEIIFSESRLWAATAAGVSIFETVSGWTHLSNEGLNTKTVQALALQDGRLQVQTDEVFNLPLTEGDDVLADFHGVYTRDASGTWTLDKLRPGLKLPPAPHFDLEMGKTVLAEVTIPELNLRIAATEDGIVYSLKNAPWKTWNEGLPTYRITALLYNDADHTLYAGTTGHGVLSLNLK